MLSAIKLHLTDDDPIALHFKPEQLLEVMTAVRKNILMSFACRPEDFSEEHQYKAGVYHDYRSKKYWRRYKRLGKS